MEELLRTRMQLKVAAARDGQEAWEWLQDGLKPALAVLDVMMPRMTGFELLQKIRSDPALRSLRVIICSSLSEREIIPLGARLGLQSFILKPYRPELVMEKVREALRGATNNVLAGRSAICAKLHINERALQRLLEQLHTDIAQKEKSIRHMINGGEIGRAMVQIAAGKASCGNLGANRLHEQFTRLEQAVFQTREFPPNWVELAGTKLERAEQFSRHLELLLDELDNVVLENNKFGEMLKL